MKICLRTTTTAIALCFLLSTAHAVSVQKPSDVLSDGSAVLWVEAETLLEELIHGATQKPDSETLEEFLGEIPEPLTSLPPANAAAMPASGWRPAAWKMTPPKGMTST